MSTNVLWGQLFFATIGMGVWLQVFFLHPLKAEAEDMQNRQLDPTEIVLVPYDLSRLWLFVAGVAFVYATTTPYLRDHWLHVLGMTLCTFIAYIVYGASPTENLWHTLAATFFLVLMIQWDVPLIKGCNLSSKDTLERVSLACRGSTVTLSLSDRMAVVKTQCLMGLTVVLQILRLYDRGWQVQRWPVPTILGATLGWIGGLWLAVLWEKLRLGTDKFVI